MNPFKQSNIIDSDAHVIETDRTWDHLEQSEIKYRPILTQEIPGKSPAGWTINGKLTPSLIRKFEDDEIAKMSKVSNRQMFTPKSAREMDDIDLRIDHLDKLGIDIQILYPTMWLQPLTDDMGAQIALTKAYNSWLKSIFINGKNRFRWACILPTLNLEKSIIEMNKAKEFGCVAVFMRSFEGKKIMTDPYFYPIYKEAEKLDLAICVHIANGNRENFDYFVNSPISISAKGFAITRIPAVIGCMWLLMSEINSLFPNLRWGFIESAAQWIPWIFNEVVRRYNSNGLEVPKNLFKKNNIFITCQNDDDLPWILKYSGSNTLILGTDYGHTDPSTEIDAISKFKLRKDISEEEKNNILQKNPKQLYKIQ